MKHSSCRSLVRVVTIAVAMLAACEHGGNESANEDESRADRAPNAEDPKAHTSSPKAPTGAIPFTTIGSESEFLDRFDEEIHDIEQLVALYRKHSRRTDGGGVRVDWSKVDFSKQFAIYISQGMVVAKVNVAQLFIDSIVSDGRRLLVRSQELYPTWCDPGTEFTNCAGHVVILEKYSVPVEYTRIMGDYLCDDYMK